MSLLNLSLDTKSRQVALSIDGMVHPVYECGFEKYVYDGKEELRFWYTVEKVNDQGLKERIVWSLPSVEDLASSVSAGIAVDDNGLISSVMPDEAESIRGLSEYISRACKFENK